MPVAQPPNPAHEPPPGASACLVLADGTILWGKGLGAHGAHRGELCFNTAMTGYQEILTDPSYAGQIITFTFPHVGNVGTNDEDLEAGRPHARGCVLRADVTEPSNFRAAESLGAWLQGREMAAITNIDTRALTRRLRDQGAINAVIDFPADGRFDIPYQLERLASWGGLDGADLALQVTGSLPERWRQGRWQLGSGHAQLQPAAEAPHIVAIDYGAKRNILNMLAATGARVSILTADAGLNRVLDLRPDGVFLSNGPGDPAATGAHAVSMIEGLLARRIPTFGICLGHQMLGLALGCRTVKMHHGHHGANHPVKDLDSGKVMITSQNHGFAIDNTALPTGVRETHVSLFDGSNQGIAAREAPAFGVQFHPEASPGPHDTAFLFEKFFASIPPR